MTLQVWTARLGQYAGDDALDVTRQGNDALGLKFAPSWNILKYHKARQVGGYDAFPDYKADYLKEMRASYRQWPVVWDHLLSLEVVTLCCVCAGYRRCHRDILARDVLAKLGAEVMGERPKIRYRDADEVAELRRDGWRESRRAGWVVSRQDEPDVVTLMCLHCHTLEEIVVPYATRVTDEVTARAEFHARCPAAAPV